MRFRSKLALGPEMNPDPRFRRLVAPTGVALTLAALVVVASSLLLLAVGAASAQTITSKREQAQAIIAEVERLDMDLAATIESWNYANIELDRIDTDLASNAKHLVAARKSLVVSQQRIATRLRDLYINGEGDSTLEVILGASSLDDIIARLDAIERVSSQDAQILRTVKRYRKEVEARRANLQHARSDQARIVAERAAQRSSIELRLAERAQMLASVKDEIAQLQAEERARQARLEAEARERLQAQQAAALASANETIEQGFDSDAIVPVAPPPDGSKASQVIAIAMQYLGVPYVWGGASPSQGFDCSGLTTYVFAQIGISLPHHAASQYNYGTPVSQDDLQPADLVFFNGLGHMGMYIGGGQFIHAPHTGDVVKISSIYDYFGSWVGARRIL
jgi:cell wall-associated NlpC family hydrolase